MRAKRGVIIEPAVCFILFGNGRSVGKQTFKKCVLFRIRKGVHGTHVERAVGFRDQIDGVGVSDPDGGVLLTPNVLGIVRFVKHYALFFPAVDDYPGQAAIAAVFEFAVFIGGIMRDLRDIIGVFIDQFFIAHILFAAAAKVAKRPAILQRKRQIDLRSETGFRDPCNRYIVFSRGKRGAFPGAARIGIADADLRGFKIHPPDIF